jgi:hypothetical protein
MLSRCGSQRAHEADPPEAGRGCLIRKSGELVTALSVITHHAGASLDSGRLG